MFRTAKAVRPALSVTAGAVIAGTLFCSTPAFATPPGTAVSAAAPYQAEPAEQPKPQSLVVSSVSASTHFNRDTYDVKLIPKPVKVVQPTVADADSPRPRTEPVPPSDTSPRDAVVAKALSYLGVPYVFAGASYEGIDCSGLVLRAYETVGVSLSHYVPTQAAVGQRISQAELQPGDLVVFTNNEHIGIYLGNGKTVHAPAPGRNVQINDNWFGGESLYYVRILAE